MKTAIGFLTVTVCILPAAENCHAEGIIEDVYQIPLTTYNKEGEKLNKKITDKKILLNKETGKATTRRLVPVDLDTGTVWVRAGQLKLSLEKLAECPDSAPGRAEDMTSPVSSGMGAECEAKEK